MLKTDAPVEKFPEKGSALEEELSMIARDIVETLGYWGAMVAAYEQGDILPVRGFYFRDFDQVKKWEDRVQQVSRNKKLSLTNPSIARVYVHQAKYEDNLSVRAAKKRDYVISPDLFDLLTPIVPKIARSIVAKVQEKLKIKQVAAIPFFMNNGEYVGNLFIASENDFEAKDIQVLSAFARRAASSIRSERRRLQAESNQRLVFDMQRYISSEEDILKRIVQGVVEDLGYVAAMVATLEGGNVLPVRAFYTNESLISMKKIELWEDRIQKFTRSRERISINNPKFARVFLDGEKDQANLSVQAVKASSPVVSDSLFDLMTPVLPNIARPLVEKIQENLNIRQVIAVPFFVDGECWGNLFAATQSEKFSDWEIRFLQTFGQNAAAGLRNAKLYKRSEDRREAAQIFGRMAFSAATTIHAFKGHLGTINLGLDLIKAKDDQNEREEYAEKLKKRVKQAAEILDSLHQPWNIQRDTDVSINACLRRALEKVFPTWDRLEWVTFDENEDLPTIKTSQEMLTEAFRNLIKNAKEAMEENGGPCWLHIQSRLQDDGFIHVTIQDNGTGIKPENYEKVFELRWGTKQSGLGFGLFWTKDYIEGLNGNISFTSKVNEGTTFMISLPVNQETDIAK